MGQPDASGDTGRISRRQLLKRTGAGAATVASAAVLGPLAADCGSTGSSGSATTSTSTSSPVTTTTPVDPADWSALSRALGGALVLPGDPSYGLDKEIYNERFDGIDPAAIAYCASPAGVQHCVQFARDHGLDVAVRSGGHSYGGYSLCSGLVIDVTQMATVATAGPAAATVGAGARLVDVYNGLAQAGVLLPGGSCPTVSIAGLALGGGVGVFGRKYGLTCDNVASLQLVTADARILTAAPGTNDDVYWACRGGGGGNFGVVTSFTFDVRPIPAISLFTLEWLWPAAAQVLGNWLEWMPTTPDELWSNCQLLSSGSSTPEIKVTGVFCGMPSTLSGLLQPFIADVGTTPIDNFVGPEGYLKAMLIEGGCEGSTVTECHLPSQNPLGTLSRSAFAAKSAYITAPLPDAGVGTLVGAVESLAQHVPQVGGGFVFDSYGGAINRIPADATAFVHRDALAAIEYSVSWSADTPASVVDGATQWLAGAQVDLAPYARGAYQNYIDPTLEAWQQAYYGTNLARLVHVKRAHDPDDFFHFAQSIPTSLDP